MRRRAARRVLERDGRAGEITSNVMASGTSRTMPIGPCGTSTGSSSCGVSSVMEAVSQRSTSTCSALLHHEAERVPLGDHVL